MCVRVCVCEIMDKQSCSASSLTVAREAGRKQDMAGKHGVGFRVLRETFRSWVGHLLVKVLGETREKEKLLENGATEQRNRNH